MDTRNSAWMKRETRLQRSWQFFIHRRQLATARNSNWSRSLEISSSSFFSPLGLLHVILHRFLRMVRITRLIDFDWLRGRSKNRGSWSSVVGSALALSTSPDNGEYRPRTFKKSFITWSTETTEPKLTLRGMQELRNRCLSALDWYYGAIACRTSFIQDGFYCRWSVLLDILTK
jgi:hypothetical protein